MIGCLLGVTSSNIQDGDYIPTVVYLPTFAGVLPKENKATIVRDWKLKYFPRLDFTKRYKRVMFIEMKVIGKYYLYLQKM